MLKTKFKGLSDAMVWLSSQDINPDKDYTIEIKEYSEKRSLNANAYLWVLCDQIAKKLRITKEEVYREQIKAVGVSKDDEVLPENVNWRREAWSQIGIGWFAERVDFSKDGEREVLRFYYGSSRYNVKQMNRLLDATVQEAKALGITTKDENELNALVEQWGKQ